MTVEAALLQLLNADATFAALVAGRVYPLESPQDGPAPFVLYATSGEDQEQTYTSFINLYRQSFRFDCYGGPSTAQGYRTAKQAARALRRCLRDFFAGTVTDPRDGSSVAIQGLFFEGGEDGLEAPAHAEGGGIDFCAVQFEVAWSELGAGESVADAGVLLDGLGNVLVDGLGNVLVGA